MLEFMSCARPVIVGVEGEARKIVEAAQAGVVIEPENANALADAVVKLAKDSPQREALGQNGRDYIVGHYSRKQTAVAYVSALEELSRSA